MKDYSMSGEKIMKFKHELILSIRVLYGVTDEELKEAGIESINGVIKESLNASVLADFLEYLVLDTLNAYAAKSLQ